MEFYFLAVFFLLGLIISSFLNVVVLRHKTGKSLGGRSKCMSCSKTLRWYELIPVISWCIQCGKCRGCGSKISMQYPIVEFCSGLLFAGYYFFLTSTGSFDIILFILGLLIISVLITIFVYDLKHMIIPDEWSIMFAVLSLVFSSFYWFNSPLDIIATYNGMWHLLAGPIFFLPFWALWYFSKGTWMGLGDGKLAVGIGWLLGLKFGIAAIVFGFWLGAIVGVLLLLITRLLEKKRRITMKSEIPFGPFLIFGTIISFVVQMDLISIVNLFM